MAEWNENKLEQELENLMEDIPVQENLEKKIAQSITRRIKRTAGITVIAILLAAAVLFLCISPLMNMMFWDPTDPGEGEQLLAFSVLRDYWETTTPYVDLVSMQVEKQGFGCYQLAIQVTNQREILHIGGANLWIEVNRGKYENRQDAAGYFTHQMHRFGEDSDAFMNFFNEQDKAEMLQDLQELPQSAYVYLSVAGEKPRGIQNLRDELGDMLLLWVQVYQPNVDFQGGLNMRVTAAYEQEDLREVLSEKELLEVYRSNLKNLLDNRKIWEQFGLCDGKYIYGCKSGALEKTYEDAQTLEMLTVKNYCISGTRDDIIAYLQQTEVTFLRVDQVRLSQWN